MKQLTGLKRTLEKVLICITFLVCPVVLREVRFNVRVSEKNAEKNIEFFSGRG